MGVWKTRPESGPYLRLGGGLGIDVAAGLAQFVPVFSKVLAAGSILLDGYTTTKAVAACQ